MFLATCLLGVWCRWLSSNTSFCKLPVSVVLRLWPASKSCRHFLSCWPPVLGKSGMAEGPEESSESYVLGELWKKRGRACVLGFPGISTRLSCPRQGGYSAEHLSVLNFCPSSQTRSLERNSHIESKQSSPISFESLKRSWSQLHCPSSRTRARAKVLRSACLRARASPCTYSSSVRVSRDLMTSTISPYKGTVRLLSARAGHTWARRRSWCSCEQNHQSVQRYSAASLCSCWADLGSSQNLEGGIRASSSLPIGCQVSSDVCCLYEVQRERARGDHLWKGK